MRSLALFGLLTSSIALSVGTSGCAFNALGRGPGEMDLENDGSDDAQSELVRKYEVVYDRGVFRRPGADPAAVAAEIHVSHVDDVSAPAWSDDAFNYLSSSDDAAEIMEDPSVGFDQFAHSGTGETVIIGTGIGAGIVGGAITWFIPTTVADGINENEQAELFYAVTGGFSAGITLGVIVAAAYTYIVPAVSTPFATPLYRKAARVFNDDVEDSIVEAAPHGDPPTAPGPDDAQPSPPEPEATSNSTETPKPVETPTTTTPATPPATP